MKPIIYIKLRPYLKEFLMNQEDAKGNKIYPKEPVRFAPKTRLRMMVDRMRYAKPDGVKPFVPNTRKERAESLAIEIEVCRYVKGDENRVYLGKDAQTKIASYIYEEMMITAVEYIKEYFIFQQRMFPRETPSFRSAYRSFFADYGIESMDEDTLRKALERRIGSFFFQDVRKKIESKTKKSAKFGANLANFGATAAQNADKIVRMQE